MKRKVLIALFSLALFLPGPTFALNFGEYVGAGSGTTLVLYHMDGNSTDSSGNANTGTDTSITYSLGNGRLSQGAGFNGSTSHIALTSVPALTNTSFTVSAFINLTATSGGAIFAEGNSGNNNPIISITPFSATQVELVNRDNSAVGLATNATVPTLSTGVWYLFTWTCSSTTSKLYVNGVLQNTTTFTANTGTFNTANVGIRIRSVTDVPFHGAIDEFIIENRIWTQVQIAQYYAFASGRFRINQSQ